MVCTSPKGHKDTLISFSNILLFVQLWSLETIAVCDEVSGWLGGGTRQESHQQRGVLQKRFGVKRPYPCSTCFMAFMGFMFFYSFFKFNIISSSFIFVELKEAQKRKKQLEDRCKIEDSIGTAAQTWNQEILPNWSTM